MTFQVWSFKWHGRAAIYCGNVIMLYKGGSTFKSMDEILKCYHLNQTASLCCCLSMSYKVLNSFYSVLQFQFLNCELSSEHY